MIFQTAKQVRILDVLKAEGFEVKQSGRLHWTRCPFHQEETASFAIYPDNHFHCFGCGKTGDVVNIYAHLHRMSNYDAACELIRTHGLTLKQYARHPIQPRREQKSLEYRINMAETNLHTLLKECRELKQEELALRLKELENAAAQLTLRHASPLEAASDPEYDTLADRMSEVLRSQERVAAMPQSELTALMLHEGGMETAG